MTARFSRLLVSVVLVLAVLACALPMGVAAGKPIVEMWPIPDFEYYDCGFTLQWTNRGDSQVQFRYFFDSQGNLVRLGMSGAIHGTITRPDTGKSIKQSFNIVESYTWDKDGCEINDMMGQHWLAWGFYGLPVPPGHPKVAIYNGHLVTKTCPGEEMQLVSWHGHVTDLCAFFSQ